jgi:prepilin-type N-terminal cleavage/methylation domain-containing protein
MIVNTLKNGVSIMRKQNSKMNRQSGFTIYEILIASAIIAIVAAVIAPLLNETKDKNVTVAQELTLMRTTVANIDDRYWDEAITSAMDNRELIDGRILPGAYRRNDTTADIFNLFGGVVTITGVDENGLTWESNGVPNGVCTKFVDDGNTLGFETVNVGGTLLVYSDTTNADITQACVGGEGSGGSADTVNIIWIRAES